MVAASAAKVTAFAFAVSRRWPPLTDFWSGVGVCPPALYEPFGLAPRLPSCGLPLVVTRNGGPSESLSDGGTDFGVLVDQRALAIAEAANRP